MAALERWGILDRLTSTGCPPISTYAFDFGAVTIEGSPGTAQSPVAYCPRRTVLDKLLVDAAVDAGAQTREGFTVTELLEEDGRVVGVRGHSEGGATVTERSRVVVGADGRHSIVARAVNAATAWLRAVPPTAGLGTVARREAPRMDLLARYGGDGAAVTSHALIARPPRLASHRP